MEKGKKEKKKKRRTSFQYYSHCSCYYYYYYYIIISIIINLIITVIIIIIIFFLIQLISAIVRKKEKKRVYYFMLFFAHHVLWSRIGKLKRNIRTLKSWAELITILSTPAAESCAFFGRWFILNCLFVFYTTHPLKINYINASFIHVILRKNR